MDEVQRYSENKYCILQLLNIAVVFCLMHIEAVTQHSDYATDLKPEKSNCLIRFAAT